MLSDPVAEAFGLIHRHPSGENFFRVCIVTQNESEIVRWCSETVNVDL